MKFLVVSPDFPFPPNHGGRADIFGRLKSLSTIFGRENIDLVSTVSTSPTGEEQREVLRYVRHSLIIPRKGGLSSLFGSLPLQVNSRRALKHMELPEKHYDAVLLEGDYVLPVLKNTGSRFGKKLLRVHNNESAYFLELGRAAQDWRKIYYFTESARFRIANRFLAKRIDLNLHISRSELQSQPEKGVWLPTTVDASKIQEPISDANPRQVLYVGSLFMPNNTFGLRWYLDGPHQILRERYPDYLLNIVGNAKNTDTSWLKQYSGINHLGELGDEQLDKVYKANSIFVAPIFHGAGVKIKVINAITQGIPVVTTTIGNEGTALIHDQHIKVADEIAHFAQSVANLIDSADKRLSLTRQAQAFIRQHYSQAQVRKIFLDALGMQSE